MIFEWIKKELSDRSTSIFADKSKGTSFVLLDDAIAAIDQIQRSLSEGHFGCSSNGEHERCDSCGIYTTCPDYNKHWFQRAFPPEENENPLNDRWIPCKYHQPKIYGKYLVTCEDIPIPQIRLFEGEWVSIADVIAWQPLPEIYKEEGSIFVEDHLSTFQNQVNCLKQFSSCSDVQICCFLCNYDDPDLCGRFKPYGCASLSGCKSLYKLQATKLSSQFKEEES